jgi:hypothetical protein
MSDFSTAIEVLDQRRREDARRLNAAETEAAYVQAQIDYDLAFRPQNTKDLPGFRKRLEKANKEAEEYRAEIASLDAAIARLDGES